MTLILLLLGDNKTKLAIGTAINIVQVYVDFLQGLPVSSYLHWFIAVIGNFALMQKSSNKMLYSIQYSA